MHNRVDSPAALGYSPVEDCSELRRLRRRSQATLGLSQLRPSVGAPTNPATRLICHRPQSWIHQSARRVTGVAPKFAAPAQLFLALAYGMEATAEPLGTSEGEVSPETGPRRGWVEPK